MRLSERLALLAMYQTDPEWGHGLALRALRMRLTPQPGQITSDVLKTTVAGLELPNPLGLAAGFDKNATAIAPLLRTGFGFVELGAATPRAQPGNPHPRLFRLMQEQAAINRFGFNNDGADAIAHRMAGRPADGVVGINLGANKDSDDRAADFATVLRCCGPHADFATVNVSSPNTERLRDLQGADALRRLLRGVLEARAELTKAIPIFLKIAPDLTERDLFEIADVAQEVGIDGIVATNTTLSRGGILSIHAGEAGGLSGQPLFEPSTRVLALLARHLGGALPLIGVGGVGSGAQAYAKIRAGASAVQIYTALVFGGFSLVGEILRDLERLLQRDGFATVAQAEGTGIDEVLQ